MKYTTLFLAISVSVSALVLSSCEKSDTQANAQQEMPPAVVNVMPVKFQSIPLIKSFSGRTTAFEIAEVRPQVTGTVTQILYKQGSFVQKGQPLFRLSTENYEPALAASVSATEQARSAINTAEANLSSAIANQESQKALLQQAMADLERYRPLLAKQAISEQLYQKAETSVKTAKAAYDNASAAVAQAQANINSAKASYKTAQANQLTQEVNFNRTIIRAPISGQTSRASVTVGALVNANQPNPLVTVTRNNPMFVDISQSSAELLNLKRQIADGSLQAGSNIVELELEDGSKYPIKGRVLLEEAKVDQNSGAATLRAIFQNDDNLLIPGMFVNARLTQGIVNNAILLPQSALIRSPKGETQVYIVDNNDMIQVRPVEINGTYKGQWIITGGLKAGEKVVITGGFQVKPEQKVVSKPYQKDTTSDKPSSNSNNSIKKPNVQNNTGPVANTNEKKPEQPKLVNNSQATKLAAEK